MDPNLVYAKTPLGANAIQQRTRSIQRNVRMVLILVDSHSSVADLANKTGNLQLTENALSELEKGGFIELRAEQPHAPPQIEIPEELPPDTEEPGETADFTRAVSFPGLPVTDNVGPLKSGFAFHVPPPATPLPIPDRLVEPEPLLESVPQPVAETTENPAPGHIPLLRDRLKSWLGRMRKPDNDKVADIDDDDDEIPKIKPVRRYSAKRIVNALVILFVLVCVALALFPFGIFRDDVESALSRATGRAVSIQEMRVGIFLNPGLNLERVQFGEGKESIRVRKLHLLPDISSLFSERGRIRRVIASGMEIQLERITEILAMFTALDNPEKSPEIRNIHLENVDVSFSGIALKNVQADVQYSLDGAPQGLSIVSADKKLNLTIEPTTAGILLTVEALDWSMDEESKFVVDALRFKGLLAQNMLDIFDLDVRVFDGQIQGNAVARVGEKPNLFGMIIASKINASKLGESVGIGGRLSGLIAGNLRFVTRSDTWATLFTSVTGEGSFNVQRGYINGFDLSDAPRRVSGTLLGGSTSFEQMFGRMQLKEESKEFYDLDIISRMMRSTGKISINKNDGLSGKLELQFKGSVQETQMSILISGTLGAPMARIAE